MQRWEVLKRDFLSLRMKAERKCGRNRNSDLWQSRQSGSAEAELHIFGNEDRVLVGTAELHIFGSQGRAEDWRRNFKSLAVQAEMTCESGTSHLWKSWQKKVRKRILRSLEVLAERSAESGTSDICQSRQSRSAEAELQIFGSQRRTKVRNGTTHLFFSSQDKAETELQTVGSQGRAEVRNRNFSSKAEVRKQNLTSLTGSYPTDCHCQRWKIALVTFILKNNVKIMCG